MHRAKPCGRGLGHASHSMSLETRAGVAANLGKTRALDRANWTGRPLWSDLLNDLRPAQCRAGSITSHALALPIREPELLPALPAPAQAMLRAQSGPHAAAWLTPRRLINICRSGGGYIIVVHVFLQLPVSVSSGNKQGYAWACPARGSCKTVDAAAAASARRPKQMRRT